MESDMRVEYVVPEIVTTNCLVCDDEIVKEPGNFIKLTPPIFQSFSRVLQLPPLPRGLGRGVLRNERVVLCTACGYQVNEFSTYFTQVTNLEKKISAIRHALTQQILSNSDTVDRTMEDYVMTARNIICSSMKLNGTAEIVLRTDDPHSAELSQISAIIPEESETPHLDPLSFTETDSSQPKTKRCSIVIKKLDLLKHSKPKRSQNQLETEYPNLDIQKNPIKRRRNARRTPATRYVCPDCGFLLKDKKCFQNHQKTHSGKKFQCPTCQKTFPSSFRLNYHMKCHDGTARFICSFSNCTSAFQFQSDYIRHVAKHTGEKSLSCKECEANFARKSTLKRHIQEVHKNTKRYSCSECKKSFLNRAELLIHEQIPISDKPLLVRTCTWCNKVFTRKECLREHELKMHQIVKSEEVTVPIPIPIKTESHIIFSD